MPRQFYDDKTRAAIVGAVASARKEGKKWAEAHTAAKGAGFKGGVPALQIFIKKAGGVKTRRRRRRVSAPVPAPQIAPQNDIAAAIDRIVQDRVRAALDKAIEVLKAAR